MEQRGSWDAAGSGISTIHYSVSICSTEIALPRRPPTMVKASNKCLCRLPQGRVSCPFHLHLQWQYQPCFRSNFFSNMDVYSLPLPPVDDMWMFLMRTLLPFIVFPPVPPVSNWWMHILELGILKCMLRFRNLQCSDYVGSEKEDFASLSDCFRHIRTTRRMPSMKLPPSRKKSSSWRVNSVNQ